MKIVPPPMNPMMMIQATPPPSISSEIPKPSAPARSAGDAPSGESETGWLLFLGLILAGALLAFLAIWLGAQPANASEQTAQGSLVQPHDRE